MPKMILIMSTTGSMHVVNRFSSGLSQLSKKSISWR